MRTGKGHVCAALVALLVSAISGSALAQPADDEDVDRAGARAAATAGAEAMDQQRWADAIDLFSRAESLVHAPPHLLYIARASVKLGQLVRAQENYLRIVREQLPANAPQPFLDAQAAAAPELEQLEARIPVVTIKVQGAESAKASVVMDGQPVPPALVGVPHPMDPGHHTFQASTPSLTSDAVEVDVAEGAHQDVALSLTHVVPGGPPPGEAAPSGDTSAPPRNGWMKPAAIAAAGVGVVGLGLGTVFMLQNRSARDDADALCPGGRCPESQRSAIQSKDSDADTAATLSWISYGVGVAGLAAGVALWVMAPSSSKGAPSSTSASVAIVPALGGATVIGRFQ